MEILEQNKKRVSQGLFVLIVILSAFFAVKILSEVRGGHFRGGNETPSTISFSGHGEVNAVPDIANVYFTISKTGKTVKEAQDAVAVVEKKALDVLEAKDIDDKDIKTANASFNPKYDYRQENCPRTLNPVDGTYYCGSRQVLTGYEANESITVKIRNTDDVGAIMQDLGTTGVSDLNGPNFAIDKEDDLKAQARKLAIDDAKEKAKVLAKDLGVRLVKITSFNESGNYPVYAESFMAKDSTVAASAPAVIPKGENTISSDVTITYEIR